MATTQDLKPIDGMSPSARKGGRSPAGRQAFDTQNQRASRRSRKGPSNDDLHARVALPDEASDYLSAETQVSNVARLVFLCRVRSQIQQAMLRFGNQIDAMERLRTGELKGKTKAKRVPTVDDIAVSVATRGHLEPLVKPLRADLAAIEREIAKATKQLPVYAFVESVRGFGALGFGLIVGAAGDLSNYANPGKLWKRMGLALVDGERQRKCSDVEKALAHGYNPRRRSMVHTLGDSLMKGNRDGYYRQVYDARKAHTLTTHPEWTKMHRHMDALRYMEKRLLRHLWQVWKRQAKCPAEPIITVPAMLDAEASDRLEPTPKLPQHPTIM